MHPYDDNMNVVRHEAPGQQPVPFAVEMQQCVLHQGSDVVAAEPAGAEASVQLLIDEANGVVA